MGIGGSVLGGTYNDNIVEQNVRHCVTEALKSGTNYICKLFKHGFGFVPSDEAYLKMYDFGNGINKFNLLLWLIYFEWLNKLQEIVFYYAHEQWIL